MNPPESPPNPTGTTPPPMPGTPQTQPGFPDYQQERDRSNVHLLAVFHFVHAGLILFGIAFLFLHYTIMSSVFLNGNFLKAAEAQEKSRAAETARQFRAKEARQSQPAPSTVLPGYGEAPRNKTTTKPSTGPGATGTAERAAAREANMEFFEDFFKAFIWFYVFAGVCLVLALVLNALSGIFMLKRKHRMFSIVVGGLNCLDMPLGTILGIFTILVLNRDSVRRLYAANHAFRGGAQQSNQKHR